MLTRLRNEEASACRILQLLPSISLPTLPSQNTRHILALSSNSHRYHAPMSEHNPVLMAFLASLTIIILPHSS